MAKTLRAMFDGEVLRPEGPVDLKPNTRYLVTIEGQEEAEHTGEEGTYSLTEILRLATDMIAASPIRVPPIKERRLLMGIRDVGAHLGEEVQGSEDAEVGLVTRMDRI